MNENKENYQRQFNTLDVIFEKKMQKRSSVFHSLPIDRTQYDRKTLTKQLELETVKIVLKDEDDRVKETFLNDYGGQCTQLPYDRVITREANEEGKMKRLLRELEELS